MHRYCKEELFILLYLLFVCWYSLASGELNGLCGGFAGSLADRSSWRSEKIFCFIPSMQIQRISSMPSPHTHFFWLQIIVELDLRSLSVSVYSAFRQIQPQKTVYLIWFFSGLEENVYLIWLFTAHWPLGLMDYKGQPLLPHSRPYYCHCMCSYLNALLLLCRQIWAQLDLHFFFTPLSCCFNGVVFCRAGLAKQE